MKHADFASVGEIIGWLGDPASELTPANLLELRTAAALLDMSLEDARIIRRMIGARVREAQSSLRSAAPGRGD